MASQAKITSFYRNSKQSATVLAAKRRKAVVDEESTEIVRDIKTPAEEVKQEVEDAKLDQPKVEPLKLKLKLEQADKSKVKRKQSTSRTKKTDEPEIWAVLKEPASKGLDVCVRETYTDEVTLAKDDHDFNPEDISTPKHSEENGTSTRKRKMESAARAAEKVGLTPAQAEEKKLETKTPNRVRKRLDMGSAAAPVASAVKEISTENRVSSSPAKVVQFLCMGALSPMKMNNNLPIKSSITPQKLMPNLSEAKPAASTAARSLASLLEKVPPKMTPEEIKSKLGKNKNLAELQAKLAKVNNCSGKVKEFYQNQVQLKKFSSIEFNLQVPVSPQKSPFKSPAKRPPTVEKRPAYERFHALAQPPTQTLVLPYKYKVLAEVFRCLETVVIMLYNRKECIYFSKLRPAVQKMLQRDFTEKHLAQVCYVFPSAYTMTQEKPMANLQSSPLKGRGYQLTLTPNLNYLTPELLDVGGSQLESDVQKLNVFQPLGPSMLIERRYVFHNRLVNIVKQHHSEFLTAFNPLLVVAEDKVTRWHPNFDVDDVPDVPLGRLPQAPEIQTFVTAKDVLEHAHHLVKVNPRLEAALKERAALFKEPPTVKVGEADEKPKPAPTANPGLKGVSQSLIDKIRAREAAKSEKQMTMNPEEIRKQSMSKMLPEIARIINSVFVTEKKAVLPLKSLVERVQYSHNSSISQSSLEEHVQLLHKVIPEWLTLLNRNTINYVKIDRAIDSNIVYQKLEDNAKI